MDVQVVKTTGRLYEISFYKYLATDMGWVRLLVLLDGTPVIGPNLKMECHGNKKDVPFDSDTQLKKNCWVLRDGRFFLSCVCNWRFTYIIGAFEGVTGTRSRSLLVYSYVGGSSVVGETKFTDLLGEVYFRRHSIYCTTQAGVRHYRDTIKWQRQQVIWRDLARETRS